MPRRNAAKRGDQLVGRSARCHLQYTMAERFVGIMAGTWLVSSAFIWRHAPLQKTNALVCGLLAIAIAIFTTYAPRARYLAAVLALWVFVSAVFAFSVHELTLWSNVICAAGIVIGVHASGPKRAAFS
jgi:hypothetical protein